MLKDILLPELSDNVTEADIVKVLVAPGEVVAAEQPLLEIETEKSVFELPSPVAGVVREVLVRAGGKAAVGQILFRLEAPEAVLPVGRPATSSAPSRGAKVPRAPAVAHPEAPRATPPPSSPHNTSGPPAAAPSVRKLARELGVDIHRVRGFGPGGRISAEDVKRFTSFGPGSQGEAPPAKGAAKPLPDFAKWGAVRREAMTQVRRLTAEAMAATALVPQVTQFDEASAVALDAFLKRHAERVQREGGKLTVTALLVKACAEALKRFPQFNASVDLDRGEIVFKEFVNIGVAVDTDRGLLVPVVKGVDQKSLAAVAAEIQALAEKARTKRILPAELEGGTFTLSNLGGIGGTGFTPLVYPPQVAILGVSRTRVEPVWDGGAFVPSSVLPLCLSYDHRLIDGADGARFLRHLCEAIEGPEHLGAL